MVRRMPCSRPLFSSVNMRHDEFCTLQETAVAYRSQAVSITHNTLKLRQVCS